MILGMMMMLLEYDVYCFYEVLDGMGLLDLVFVGIFCIWDVKVIFLLFRLIIFENECCIFFGCLYWLFMGNSFIFKNYDNVYICVNIVKYNK